MPSETSPHLVPWLFFLAAALFFACATVLRHLFYAGRFCRPIFAALLFWIPAYFLAPNQAPAVLGIGVFFELLFLDLLYVGTYVPPQTLFPFMSCLVLGFFFQLDTPEYLTFIIVICLPLAYLGAMTEQRLRRAHNRWHGKIIKASVNLKALEGVSRRSIRSAAFRSLFMALALFSGCTALLLTVLKIWQGVFGNLPIVAWIDWHYLITAAAIGGILALRIRWAFTLFGVGVLLIGFLAV